MAFLMTDTFDVVGTRDIPARSTPPGSRGPILNSCFSGGVRRPHLHARRDGCAGRRPLAGLHERTRLGLPGALQHWTYTLVDAPNRLEFVHNMSDEHGTTIDAEGIPRDVRHVITFEAIAPDVTRLTVRESTFPTAEARDMSSRGLEECLDKLVAIYT